MTAQGHLIPALDTALLLATHGAVCRIVATPIAAARVSATVLPLDYTAVGLPEGVDHMDPLPREYMRNFFEAMALLRALIESHLRAHEPFPTCVVSDFCHHWTTELAASLGVPRLIFHSMCAFFLLCQHNVKRFHAYDGVVDDNTPVVVPGLEKRVIKVMWAQAPGFFRKMPDPWWEEFGNYVERTRAEADGVVINTFQEMEPEFVAGYATARRMKIWTVRPVSLYHHQRADTLATRGKTTALDAEDCLRWLDGKEPSSVIYVSFGSIVQANTKQAVELGLGLEASGHPFVWAIRNVDAYDYTVREFLRDLEARVAGHGLILRGWAPQVLILSHAAVGGFVTHCGWNSTMEAVTAELPLVTWPHFSDQLMNEKMAMEVLGIGVRIGMTEPLIYQVVQKEIVVGRDVVEKAIRRVMGGGEEGEERRRRVRALAAKARVAVHEGGLSHTNLVDLVKCFGMGDARAVNK